MLPTVTIKYVKPEKAHFFENRTAQIFHKNHDFGKENNAFQMVLYGIKHYSFLQGECEEFLFFASY
jgi:hypothetical protein